MKVYLVKCSEADEWTYTDVQGVYSDLQKATNLYNKLAAKEKYGRYVYWIQEWNTETQKTKVIESSDGEID